MTNRDQLHKVHKPSQFVTKELPALRSMKSGRKLWGSSSQQYRGSKITKQTTSDKSRIGENIFNVTKITQYLDDFWIEDYSHLNALFETKVLLVYDIFAVMSN